MNSRGSPSPRGEQEAAGRRTIGGLLRKPALGLSGFLCFIIALELMKTGASGLALFMRNHLSVTNPADSMGFGWLMAYLLLSGSPAAAAAVALLSANALSALQTFTMIAGSRLGASSIVLLLGYIYHQAGRHERSTALAPGVLCLMVTATVQALAVPLGLTTLGRGWLSSLSLPALKLMAGGLDQVLQPIVGIAASALPDWALFVVGVALTTLSFRFFDRALPELHLERTDLGQAARLVYRPEVMLLMGLVVTLVTLSVSVSVSILIPLSARGYMRRENIVPYILGANVSTFVDTLVAAALLGHPAAVGVVVTHMVWAAVVSLLYVLVAFQSYERTLSRALTWVTSRRRNMVAFLVIIVALPAVLVIV